MGELLVSIIRYEHYHPPLNNRCPIRISNRVRPTYVNSASWYKVRFPFDILRGKLSWSPKYAKFGLHAKSLLTGSFESLVRPGIISTTGVSSSSGICWLRALSSRSSPANQISRSITPSYEPRPIHITKSMQAVGNMRSTYKKEV